MTENYSGGSGDKKKKDAKDVVFCEICGAPMRQWQCRYVCPRCGYTTTCSEENQFYYD